MPGNKESEDFFFRRQPRVFIPVGRVRERVASLLRGFIRKHAKQPVLSRFRVPLRFLCLLDRRVERLHELRPAPESIHGPALDQRLQHALVQQTQINFFAEFVERLEIPAELLPPHHNRLDRIATNILHCRKPKPDRLPVRRKVRIAHVNIGRFDRNPHLTAFVDVLHHVIRAARHRSEQRRHEIDWMVRLQICGVIRQQRVCRGVRFVESVSGKLRHQIKNLLNLLRRKSALRRSLHKALALLGHLLGILFAHRPPQQVGLSEGVAGKLVRRLHYLLLIDEDAQRLLQNLFQLRQFVFDLPPPMLALDKIIDHAALNRPGTV